VIIWPAKLISVRAGKCICWDFLAAETTFTMFECEFVNDCTNPCMFPIIFTCYLRKYIHKRVPANIVKWALEKMYPPKDCFLSIHVKLPNILFRTSSNRRLKKHSRRLEWWKHTIWQKIFHRLRKNPFLRKWCSFSPQVSKMIIHAHSTQQKKLLSSRKGLRTV
jgi:hypothetical protein